MEMYKRASRVQLRFETTSGLLSVEQLWSLSLPKLEKLVKTQYEKIKEDGVSNELSFLNDVSKVDETEKLRFDILKDIYMTKNAELIASHEAAAVKEHNQKILQLINMKQDQELQNKSIDELRAMLKS
jgi:hypothetical protein